MVIMLGAAASLVACSQLDSVRQPVAPSASGMTNSSPQEVANAQPAAEAPATPSEGSGGETSPAAASVTPPTPSKLTNIPCGKKDECSLCDKKYVEIGYPEHEAHAALPDNTPEKSQQYAKQASEWLGVKYVKFHEFKDKTNAGVGFEHTYCWKAMKTDDFPIMKQKGYEIMEYGDNNSCRVTDTGKCAQPIMTCNKSPGDAKFSCSFDLAIYNAEKGECPNHPTGTCTRFLK
jgi:hypothetical protein